MTREELEKLFSLSEYARLFYENTLQGKRQKDVYDLQEFFGSKAIDVILDVKNEPEAQRKLANHLWRAYVIAMAYKGVNVVPFDKMVREMKIPSAISQKKTKAEGPNEAGPRNGPEKLSSFSGPFLLTPRIRRVRARYNRPMRAQG